MPSFYEMLITPEYLEAIRADYRLRWTGIHGYDHWWRVYQNGLQIASMNGANPRILTFFAFTHDSQRWNDGHDSQHGLRASHWIITHASLFKALDKEELTLLRQACEQHTGGRHHPDLTVRSCWDSDRLDLMRVGTLPNPHYLCTESARDPRVLEWAIRRSLLSGDDSNLPLVL